MDRHIGLIDHLTTAITDLHNLGYIKHSLYDLLTQRTFQIASGYEDGYDSNTLRRAPVQAGSGTRLWISTTPTMPLMASKHFLFTTLIMAIIATCLCWYSKLAPML